MAPNQPPTLFPNLLPVLIVILLIGAVIYGVLQVLPMTQSTQVAMTGPGSIVALLRQDLQAGVPATLTQAGDTVTLQAQGRSYRSTFDSRFDILAFLRHAGIPTESRRFRTDVTVRYASPNEPNRLLDIGLSLVPLLIFALLLLYLMYRRH